MLQVLNIIFKMSANYYIIMYVYKKIELTLVYAFG